jgi:hypothetical protein
MNPFLVALKTNPAQFLAGLDTAELQALSEGCVVQMIMKAKRGDRKAMLALQSVYRIIGEVEI